jgi:hypothetical protein
LTATGFTLEVLPIERANHPPTPPSLVKS